MNKSCLVSFVLISAFCNVLANINEKASCPKILISNSSVSCSSGNDHGSLCFFKCDEGFEKSGSMQILCSDGQWYDFEKIETVGKVYNSLFDYNSRCGRKKTPRTFLRSSSESNDLRCSPQICSDSIRGMSKYSCEQVNCCWDDETFECRESICQFRGVSKFQCLKEGCQFDDDTLNCFQKRNYVENDEARFGGFFDNEKTPSNCPTLVDKTLELNVSCKTGRMPGSLCEISCVNSDKVLEGPKTIFCKLDGKWNVKEGLASSKCNFASSQCSVKDCDINYSGIQKNSCEKSGCCWDYSSDSCKAKRCKDTYKGIPKKMCQLRGCVYDEETADCYEAVQCPALSGEENSASVKCSKGKGVYSLCRFSCPSNFDLLGENYSICLKSGIWKNLNENKIPKCKAKCGFVANMKDGFIKNDQEDVVSIFEEMSDSKKDLCDRAGIIEIDFLKKNNFRITLDYDESASYIHFALRNQNKLLMIGIHRTISFLSTTKRLAVANSKVILKFRKGDNQVSYVLRSKSKEKKIERGNILMKYLKESNKLYLSINKLMNRNAKSHFGKGLCSVCLSYQD